MRSAGRQGRGGGGRARRMLSAGYVPALALLPVPAFAQSEWFAPAKLDLMSTGALSIILAGLTVFATTTSLVYVRERSRWQRREARLASELEAARGHQERLSILLAADPQVIASWNGRDAQPVFEGDSGFLGAPGAALALAYGSWAAPTDAKRLELATDGYQDAHELAHANDIRRRFGGQNVTTWQIVLFGLTGGLIPCPAAITVLLLCLQLKEFVLGFVLVLCFSIGLAITLVTVGAAAALSVQHATKRWSWFSTFARRAPYFSGILLIGVGLYVGWHGLSVITAGPAAAAASAVTTPR